MMHSHLHRPAACAAFVLLVLTALACPRPPDDRERIAAMLDLRDRTLAAKDLPGFLATLAADYLPDPSTSLTEPERIARYFDQWASVTAESTERIVNVDGDQAQALQRVHWVGRDAEGKAVLEFTGPERLTLVRRNGDWKIVTARHDLDAIVQVLEMRRHAMEAHDLTMYLAAIDPGYKTEENDLASLRAYMEKMFSQWDATTVRVLARRITVQDNSAEAIQECAMRIAAGDQSLDYEPKERILLSRGTDGTWRITGGI